MRGYSARELAARVLLLASVSILCSCQASPTTGGGRDREGNGLESFDIPTDWVMGYALGEVWIGHQGPYRFLLDSASEVVAVSEELVVSVVDPGDESDGVVITDDSNPAVGRRKSVQSLVLADVSMGNLDFDEIPAVVLSMSFLRERLGTEVDGILGLWVFQGVTVRIDYPRRRVSVSTERLQTSRDQATFPFAGGLPSVTLRLGDVAYQAVIDTGFDGPVAFPRECASQLKWRTQPVPFARVATIAGPSNLVEAGRLATSVRLGPFLLLDPIAMMEVRTSRVLLGTDVLQAFAVTFDMERGLVRLAREGGRVVSAPSLRGIGCGFLGHGDAWTVSFVIPGSPAEQVGLVVGDRVVAVDGHPVGQLGMDGMRTLVNTRKKLELEVVKGDGGRRTLSIRVRTIVK